MLLILASPVWKSFYISYFPLQEAQFTKVNCFLHELPSLQYLPQNVVKILSVNLPIVYFSLTLMHASSASAHCKFYSLPSEFIYCLSQKILMCFYYCPFHLTLLNV